MKHPVILFVCRFSAWVSNSPTLSKSYPMNMSKQRGVLTFRLSYVFWISKIGFPIAMISNKFLNPSRSWKVRVYFNVVVFKSIQFSGYPFWIRFAFKCIWNIVKKYTLPLKNATKKMGVIQSKRGKRRKMNFDHSAPPNRLRQLNSEVCISPFGILSFVIANRCPWLIVISMEYENKSELLMAVVVCTFNWKRTFPFAPANEAHRNINRPITQLSRSIWFDSMQMLKTQFFTRKNKTQ